MLREDLIVEDQEDCLGVCTVDEKTVRKGCISDFNGVKMQRIMKLQQILNKNIKLRQTSTSNKRHFEYPVIDKNKLALKGSLPLIKSTQKSQQQISTQKFHNKSIFSQETHNQSSLLKKYQQTLVLNSQHAQAFLKHELDSRILEENPQSQQKQAQRSRLKLKVKNLQLEQVNKNPVYQPSSKLKSSISKQSITVSKLTMERVGSIERFILNHKQTSELKEVKKDLRRKRRNASTLNLAKIEHLPQIVFPANSKCSKSRFPSMSMAQIDNNLLVHEISELEGKRAIEAKIRDKKERMLKQKIKSHQRTLLLQSMYQ